MRASKKPRRGRPPEKDHAEHRMATFRLKNRTYAQLIVIEDALALSTRTSALQFAVEQLFRRLPQLTSMSPARIEKALRAALGPPKKRGR